MARKTDYREEFDEQAKKLTMLGLTNKQLAEYFDVCEATIYNWCQSFPSFLESIKEGGLKADAEVAHSLFKRATGLKVEEVTIGENGITTKSIEFAPDVRAMEIWLRNRRKEEWSTPNKHELTGKDGAPLGVKFEGMSDEATNS